MKRIVVMLIVMLMAFSFFAGSNETASAESNAPIAENMEFLTYRNISFGGRLDAHAPSGEKLKFFICTEPVKGRIELEENGHFVYTPDENKKGRDYFGYKAMDESGRCSQEATVIIKIQKQKQAFSYCDMSGKAAEYAAVRLNELGIFTGERLCGQYVFDPEREVSRGEFISMCMYLCDSDPLSAALSTGYSDDADIPDWLKPYAVTAVMSGADTGLPAEDGRYFAGTASLSYEQAALILDNILNTSIADYLEAPEKVDAAAAQACMNLSACGLVYDSAAEYANLSREEAALMLLTAWQIKENR